MPPLTREQVLDELEFLAAVEHSLCVEYLSVQCALGHDLPADEGSAAQDVADAARSAGFLAQQHEMRHLHHLNTALVHAGRDAQLGRALGIRRSSGVKVGLGPLTLPELDRLVKREHEIAEAVDERYERLRRAVAPPNPLFEGDLLQDIRAALDPEVKHASLPSELEDKLHALLPSQYVRARPDEPRDDLEARLVELSDHSYGLLVAIVRIWLANEDAFFGLGEAIGAMNSLDKVNFLLVGRGLLPAFPPAVVVADPLDPPVGGSRPA